MKEFKVMFICTGNICRSPLAHAVFEQIVGENNLSGRVSVESSGTDAWHLGESADRRMMQVSKAHGVPITHQSARLCEADLNRYNLLLTMDSRNYRDTLSLAQTDEQRAKVRMFRDYDPVESGDVPDPWYGGMDGFEEVWTIVNRTCKALFETVKKTL